MFPALSTAKRLSDHTRAGRTVRRAAIATALAADARSRGHEIHAADLVEQRWPSDRVTRDYLTPKTRGDVAVATTGTSGWASELNADEIAEYVSTLPGSAASAIIAGAMRLKSVRAISVPMRASDPTGLPFVAEGEPIPARDGLLDAVPITPRKIAVLVGLTRETLKLATADAVVTTLLDEEVAAGIDAAVFGEQDVSASDHVGLLHDLDSLPATGDMLGDLQALARAAAGSGQLVFVAAPGRAAAVRLAMPQLAYPMLPSIAVPADRVIAVDAGSLAFALGDLDMSASKETVLHMDDEPEPIVASGTPASPTRSMFQTDCIALRALLDLGFVQRRSNAVAFIDIASGNEWH